MALLTPQKQTTHLRIRSVRGRPFVRFGRTYDHNPTVHPISDFDARQLHELLGPHNEGTLQVEELSQQLPEPIMSAQVNAPKRRGPRPGARRRTTPKKPPLEVATAQEGADE